MGCKGSKTDKKSSEPHTFCQRFGNELSLAVGVAVAASFIVPILLLTDTPCTTTTTLTRGEQLFCVAPAWAGSGNLRFKPGTGISAYIFEAEPPVDPSAAPVTDVRSESDVTISGYTYTSHSAWVLTGSTLRASINATSKVDIFYVNATAFEDFKYGRNYTSLLERRGVSTAAFDHVFAPPAEEEKLQQLTVIIQNEGSASVTVNWTLAYEFTQLNLAGALETCTDSTSCSFANMREGLVMLAVAHSNFSDDQSRLTMGWSYRANISVPGVTVTLCGLVAVIIVVALLIICNQKKTYGEASDRQQVTSDTSGVTPSPAPNDTPLPDSSLDSQE